MQQVNILVVIVTAESQRAQQDDGNQSFQEAALFAGLFLGLLPDNRRGHFYIRLVIIFVDFLRFGIRNGHRCRFFRNGKRFFLFGEY